MLDGVRDALRTAREAIEKANPQIVPRWDEEAEEVRPPDDRAVEPLRVAGQALFDAAQALGPSSAAPRAAHANVASELGGVQRELAGVLQEWIDGYSHQRELSAMFWDGVWRVLAGLARPGEPLCWQTESDAGCRGHGVSGDHPTPDGSPDP